MSELLVNRLTKVLREALVFHAEKDKSNGDKPLTSKVKIIISTPDDETCFPVYRITRENAQGEQVFLRKEGGDYNKHQGLEDFWTLLEVMDSIADWFGYQSQANESLPEVFKRLCAEVKQTDPSIVPTAINMMVWTPQDDKECAVALGLYKDFSFIREMDMGVDLFKMPVKTA